MTQTLSHSEWIAAPPSHDDQAEIAILGAILIDTSFNYFIEVSKRIKTADFFDARHAAIFQAMRECATQEIAIDPLTVRDELLRRGKLEHVGGFAYLTELSKDSPSRTNVAHYADIVKKHSVRRRLVKTLSDLLARAETTGEDSSVIIAAGNIALAEMSSNPSTDWRELFHTYEQAINAPPLRFAIKNFLQCDAATLLAGLSGQYKTWLMLSIVKAQFEGEGKKLWGLFDVLETSSRVIYLIPESSLGPFMYRVDKLGLMPYVRNGKLLCRTLSLGPAPKLQDPRLLAAVQGANVYLDTAVRFIEGDESSASDNNRGLGADIFALQAAGARTVFAAAHSPKAFSQQNFMELENMVRGSGDISAAFATAFGVRQLPGDVAHIQNIKPRDFEPYGPFQLAARPYLDEIGDFQLLKAPGDCGTLTEEMPDLGRNKGGGAPATDREAKNANLEILRGWLRENPLLNSSQISQRFAQIKIKVGDSAIRKYRKELSL